MGYCVVRSVRPLATVPVLALLVLAVWFAPAVGADRAQPEVVVMTSLEWPPYSGAGLPYQGASVAVARAAFRAVGVELQVEFYPWQRAVDTARSDFRVDGYFPEYPSEALARDFLYSEAMGSGQLGLVMPEGGGFDWERPADLAGRTIGTVMGYVNTAVFDRMAAGGAIHTQPVVDDAANLRKVAAGRVEAAVMDRNVFRYLLDRPENGNLRHRVRFHGRILEDKTLHLCFRRGMSGERLVELFNRGLSMIDAASIQAETMQRIFEVQRETGRETGQ